MNAMAMLAVSDYVRYLVFPLVVLLAGALVTGLLIPDLTRARENQRQALEIRTKLVGEISEAVMQFMVALQFVVLGDDSQRSTWTTKLRRSTTTSQIQKEYHDAYKTWETKRAVLGTMLEAYFPGSEIADEWDKFEVNVRRFSALSGVSEPGERRRLATELLMELTRSQRHGSDAVRNQSEWTDTWEQLRKAIFSQKRLILARVRDAQIDGLDEESMLTRNAGRLRKLWPRRAR